MIATPGSESSGLEEKMAVSSQLESSKSNKEFQAPDQTSVAESSLRKAGQQTLSMVST